MVFSRAVPQQGAQISPPTPGQSLRARRFSHNLQGIFTASIPLSYHRKMARTQVYLKVELDLPESQKDKERPERVAAEICRVIRRVYGVRNAEVSSIIERET